MCPHLCLEFGSSDIPDFFWALAALISKASRRYEESQDLPGLDTTIFLFLNTVSEAHTTGNCCLHSIDMSTQHRHEITTPWSGSPTQDGTRSLTSLVLQAPSYCLCTMGLWAIHLLQTFREELHRVPHISDPAIFLPSLVPCLSALLNHFFHSVQGFLIVLGKNVLLMLCDLYLFVCLHIFRYPLYLFFDVNSTLNVGLNS